MGHMRSRQEDEHGRDEAVQERQSINTMRAFHHRSLSMIKLNNRRSPSDDKTKVSSSARKTYGTLAPIEETTKIGLGRLMSMKIDPTIFINMKKGKVSENYQIDKLLGEGTYGKVLLVTHKKTGLKRALKSSKQLTSHKTS
jgi:hypothetical protein